MIRPLSAALITLLTAVGLTGCAESQRHMSADFGLAVRQDAAAQVADPDALYKAALLADGRRVGLGMDRYQTGKILEPQALSTKVGPAPAATKGP